MILCFSIPFHESVLTLCIKPEDHETQKWVKLVLVRNSNDPMIPMTQSERKFG